jgi:aminopeptidase N
VFNISESIPENFLYMKGSWTDFMDRKFSGIDSDILNTTHPIRSQIANTGESEAVFDGSSYGKGASFLK